MALDWTNKVDGVDEVKAKDVNDLAHAIQDMEANPAMHPYINSSTGHWMVWNATTEQYEDSGVAASGFVDANVIDSLNSQSATDALSANQGYVLNGILATAQLQLNEVKASLSHDNLLDNPWFTINQRGQNSYSGSLVYTVDRWITTSGSANISTNGVTVNGTPDFFQKHELGTFEIGKTYTMSAIVDNVLKYWTFEWKDMQQFSPDMGGWRFSSFHNWYGFSFVSINIPTQNEHTIKAAKLELGTISTLHLDAPPNPQVELAKCQRFRVRLNFAQYETIGNAAWGTTWLNLQLSLPTEMRLINPTVNITCAPTKVSDNVALPALSSATVRGNNLSLGFALTSGETGSSYIFAATDGYIDIIADL